ncbi:MAG: SAM-dependent chlorinase/fluorinase [Acidobacteria bacterium]|nr:SAM-dependent chlorinase/fluorinase [Acidobacteriota bacterium]
MVITLLTDFGTADYFVGAMKGAVLSVNASAQLVDLTHDVEPHDVEAGAFTLLEAYRTFPPGTIHVAVVDPGVGSARRPILVVSDNYFFVGPDNGLFSYVYEREEKCRVFHLTNEEYFRRPVSATFHGRDVFAPVAGALSQGVAPQTLGREVSDYVRLAPLAPSCTHEGIQARIIHIDRFGNCITNLTRVELSEESITRGARLKINGREIRSFRKFFAEPDDESEELFAVWGSAGFLEIAAFRQSAARLLDIERGQEVSVSVPPAVAGG